MEDPHTRREFLHRLAVLVDVQWDYGEAETKLAPLLNKRRADIFIVTKTAKEEKAQVVASIEESLGRLGIESAGTAR